MKAATSHYGYTRNESTNSKVYLATHRPTIWPDHCPECGAAMHFEFRTPDKEDPGAGRVCPAGHTLTARQCAKRAEKEAA